MHTRSCQHGWGWLTPYSGAIVAVLLVGSFLRTRPGLQGLTLGPSGMPISVGIHVVANILSLALVYLIAHRSAAQLPDDGGGATLLRSILRPLAALALCTLLGRSVGDLLTPHVSQDILQYGKWIMLIGLAGPALWFSVAWLQHTTALSTMLHGAPKPRSADLEEGAGQQTTGDEEPTTAQPTAKAQTVSSPADEVLGATLGRYKILKEIGHGSMGVVYLGKDPTIQRYVAIKTVPLGLGEDEKDTQEIKKSFFREAESTGRLSHPNIVTIYDAGEQDGLGYIAMEYLEGTTLKSWCQSGKLLPVSQAVNLVVTVADALDYAHRQGIVHRDIKPANIILTYDHRIKVTDFGIAKLASSTKTHTNVILGTPSYMSPEQAAGKKVDGRADIFSLGIVLYELLTGDRPFRGDDVVSLLFQICKEPHVPLTAHRSDLPPGLVHAIDHALKKEPAHRYARASDFGQALRVALQAVAA